MQESNMQNKTFTSFVILSFILSITYAIIRYNIIGPVPWKDLPLFILNKGVSLSSFILLTASFSIGPLTNLGIKIHLTLVNSRHAFGVTGFILAMIHMLISLILFNPVMYEKFFLENGSLSISAGLSMLGGILSLVVLWWYNLSMKDHIKMNKSLFQLISSKLFILMTLLFAGLHLLFMGYKGWLVPSEWHGGLPPISLIGFVLFILALIINLLGRK